MAICLGYQTRQWLNCALEYVILSSLSGLHWRVWEWSPSSFPSLSLMNLSSISDEPSPTSMKLRQGEKELVEGYWTHNRRR